ncbi:MAG TPA: outer membrane beta-barrel protein [Flavobacteriales bacterium]|nr:outer membrane beta-barrel protein [Flavobacteriales bacterium]
MRSTSSLALLLLLLLPLVDLAQDKGFISGTLSYDRGTSSSGDHDGPITTTVNLVPVVGFNLGEHIVLCAGLGWKGTSSEETLSYTDVNGAIVENGERTGHTSLVVIEPFVRYVKKVSDQFTFYGFARVGYGVGSNTTEIRTPTVNSKETADVTQVDAGVGPGVVYVIAPRWALNADWGVLGWTSTTTKQEDQDDYTTSSLKATLNPGAITFGLNWLF